MMQGYINFSTASLPCVQKGLNSAGFSQRTSMSNVLYDIFAGRENSGMHDEFVRYSRGIFPHKYLVEAKRQKAAWAIKTSAEFANYLVRACLARVTAPLHVTGVVVSTFDVHTEAQKLFPVAGVKRFAGIKQLVIDTDVKPSDILALMQQFPRAFFALSFTTSDTTLKIKAKAPKSAKPTSNGEKTPAAEFCSVKTNYDELVKTLLFDIPECKEAKISHTVTIAEIVLPKGVSDPVQMREQSKRRGTITRIAVVDGKETRKEAVFEA